eukprot:CAMPEP_0201546318 /NCGR_PEP_ID=MMETSP0173_2-20130828/2633_1 /ASSEMBLY_ACC=CAM_ASM_000268 /TAXON_ID=218659 /ORGANISM="Vexillifera sp., Strain DIVA3 564/2" /LENGTH=470 /DNA_ID=CAMNT_0047954945 /DNA_START=128 /DNA_END=1537 /DNA_ORIENTATION=-
MASSADTDIHQSKKSKVGSAITPKMRNSELRKSHSTSDLNLLRATLSQSSPEPTTTTSPPPDVLGDKSKSSSSKSSSTTRSRISFRPRTLAIRTTKMLRSGHHTTTIEEPKTVRDPNANVVILNVKRKTSDMMKKLGLFTRELWPALYDKEVINDKDHPPLIRWPLDNWEVELGQPSNTAIAALAHRLVISGVDEDEPVYQNHFLHKEHDHYFAADTNKGPFVVSVLRVPENNRLLRVIVRSQYGIKNGMIKPTRSIDKQLVRVCEIGEGTKFRKVRYQPDSRLTQELVRQEQRRCEFRKTFGFGVLYASASALTEDDIYSNNDPSPDYTYFLENILGEKISLLGWEKYRAGLDVKETKSTGTHSIYTEIHGYQVMYHVSTMLPFSANNAQQLARKRHIGNDIVVIVYKEGKTPFNPELMHSQMNQTFVVVQKIDYEGVIALEEKVRKRIKGKYNNVEVSTTSCGIEAST